MAEADFHVAFIFLFQVQLVNSTEDQAREKKLKINT